MKGNKFLSVISTLSFIFILLGGTFSFFTLYRGSSEGAVQANAAQFGANITISSIYTDNKLIPMNDSDIFTAFSDQYKCVDSHGYGACDAYLLTIENIGEALDYEGTINFSIDGITNLNYMILDESDNIYVNTTRIVAGNDMTLGNAFTLPKEGTKVFKLLIWLSNYDRSQNIEDNGTYNATISYVTNNGSMITGSISSS